MKSISLKKIVASVAVVALVASNTAFAAVVGSVTGGTTNSAINDDASGGSGTVLVTAVVQPSLTMSISTGALAFGDLGVAMVQRSLTLTTVSNAKSGLSVTMGSTGLATGAANTDYHIGALQRASSVATTGADSYQVRSSGAVGGTFATLADVTGTPTAILTAANVADANKVTTVDLQATATAQTEAGSYNDTLTFTVVGNF